MNVFRFRSDSTAVKSPPTPPSENHEPILKVPEHYEPILQNKLNEDQKGKLDRLLDYTESVLLDKEDPYFINERGFLTRETVHRYMRARKWNYEAAKTMLENTIHWRRDFKPDMLDAEYIRPEAETGKMYYSGFDNTGKPLWIMKPRYENSKDSERQVKHIVFCLERGIRLMPNQVEKISIVVDFKDSTVSNNANVATCKKFLDILGNHYPERLGVAYLVNGKKRIYMVFMHLLFFFLAPWFFMTTFKIISPFMDPVTRDKIKFIDDSLHLKEFIPLESMETELCGTYSFSFNIDIYWKRLLEVTGDPYKVIDYK
ncbi:CRAL/TRIO domain-containing protein [Backusella circina FSU 941]|nr:CRAL/TRIO domain-containing protein [Backusella circina FSU 941]